MDEAFFKALAEKLGPVAPWLRRQAPKPGFWLLLLLGCILAYYGSYFRHDLRFRDEGGTIALNAQRLLQGERPFLDITLNYNLLWYYPVVGLFHLAGVSFQLMRLYFFALSALAAILGFLALQRAGRQPVVAFLTALVCVLVPGMIFKNYIPLLVIANSALLMLVALGAPGSLKNLALVCAGGLLLGITFLVRIDLGLFFTLLWLGLHALRLLDRAVPARRRLAAALAGPVLTIGLAALVHLPVIHDARARGFEEPFLAQYRQWPQLIQRELALRLGLTPPAPAKPKASGHRAAKQASLENAADSQPEAAPPEERAPRNKAILKRSAWHNLIHAPDFSARMLWLLTYLPAALCAAMLAWILARLAAALRSKDCAADAWRHPLAALVLIGGALTAFPQFFFFRPDAPHLSEFSPGYWVAMMGAWLLLQPAGAPWLQRLQRLPFPGRFFLMALGLHATVYLLYTVPNRWTGSIEARWERPERFEAENGVVAYVSKSDLPGLKALQKAIQEHSKPGDYLVAYPYHPMLNLMSNRPTYEKDVYADNATRTRNWSREAIARLQEHQPALIVLSEWAINGHEDSRFSVWAAPTKAWIQANYQYLGLYTTEVDAFELYARRTP